MKHVIRISLLVVAHSWICAATMMVPKKNDSKVQVTPSYGNVRQPYADHATVLPQAPELVEPCSQIASVVYGPQLHAVDLPIAQKQNLISLWNSLYLGYLVRQAGSELFERSGNSKQTIDQYWQALKDPSSQLSTNPFCMYTALKQDPVEIAASKICIDTSSLQTQPINIAHCRQNLENMYQACSEYQNVLKDLQDYLTSVSDSSWNDVQKNYVTQHMQKAVARMAATCSIQKKGLSCTPQFTGDIRDMGIIVNIQNNTDTTYALIQTSTDGKQAAQIGTLTPGLNNVNLHTAAMIPVTSTAKNKQNAAYQFDIVPMGSAATEQDLFSVKMMSGKELVTLLRSVSNNKKDIFVMNGRKVAKKYAVDEKGDFLVIVQIPKNPTAVVDGIPVGQRIQAFCMSPFTSSVILTMQINEQEITIQPSKKQSSDTALGNMQDGVVQDIAIAQKQMVQQPSFVSAQEIGFFKEKGILPIIILPLFLINNAIVNMYWILLQTMHIAMQTDFAFFDQKCFANIPFYFEKTEFFDVMKACRLVIDGFNVLNINETLYDAPWVMATVLYESILDYSDDIPSVYITQDSHNNKVGNNKDAEYINFIFVFGEFYKKFHGGDMEIHDLGKHYDVPYNNVLFNSILRTKILQNVFFSIYRNQINLISVKTSYKNESLSKVKKIFLSKVINKIEAQFLSLNFKNWHKAEVSSVLINRLEIDQIGLISEFKLRYLENNKNNNHEIDIQKTSAIDKMDFLHTVYFKNYPITEMVYEVFKSFKMLPVTRCSLIEGGNKPSFLSLLTEQDWMNGIYFIPSVKHNEGLSLQKPGVLTITCYRHDFDILGSIDISGKTDPGNIVGIIEPVGAYNLYSKEFPTLYELGLTTGIFLKYAL